MASVSALTQRLNYELGNSGPDHEDVAQLLAQLKENLRTKFEAVSSKARKLLEYLSKVPKTGSVSEETMNQITTTAENLGGTVRDMRNTVLKLTGRSNDNFTKLMEKIQKNLRIFTKRLRRMGQRLMEAIKYIFSAEEDGLDKQGTGTGAKTDS